MSKFISTFSLFLFLISPAKAAELIVWNVGQGQWITEVQNQFCIHYDLGGEKNPTVQVLQFCQKKMNYLHLSHLDWDHISFVQNFVKRAPRSCLLYSPKGPGNSKKEKILENLKLCRSSDLRLIPDYLKVLHQSRKIKDSNSSSQVVWSLKFKTLIPGDSPKSQEKIWRARIPWTTKGLILGHHGSRTSSSPQVMSRMPQLRWAVASARGARYGHPHKQVVELLKKEKVPLLKTEDWGHLHFY